MDTKTYLIVYDAEGEVLLAKVDLTDEQAFELGCISAVAHIVPLPLTEDALEEISVSDALALETEFDEDDTRWDGDFLNEEDEDFEDGDLLDLDEEDLDE